MDATPVTKGTRLNERFELLQELGVGGTASVWEAEDIELGVRRAIKILNVGRPGRRLALRKRLKAEARAMARLAHPNVLTIYDVSSTVDLDFVVMDLAEGGSLSEWLERTGPMDPHTALSFTVQVLSALAAAHAAGMVHRDVKPQNVLLNARGTALLADFGIALLTEDQHRNTRTGVAMGSLSFMPPEQRLDARSVSASADIYATGAMLYNLLTGANPVDLFTVDVGSKRFEGLPSSLQQILVQATRHDPARRYESAQAMAREIVRFLPDAGSQPYRDSASNPENFPQPSRSLMTGQDMGRTPTIDTGDEELGPETLDNPTLLPMDEDATRAAITFLGDDFELYAARVQRAGELQAELRGAGLTQVPAPNEPELPQGAPSAGLNQVPEAEPEPAAPLVPKEEEGGFNPLWLLLLLIPVAGLAWFYGPGSAELPVAELPEPDVPSVVEPEPEPVSVEPEPEPEPTPEPVVADLSPPPVDPGPSKASTDRAKADPPADPPEEAPADATGPPFGKWQVSGAAGALGYVELSLRGNPAKVQATWTAFAGGRESKTPLYGRFDPDSGRLKLASSNGRDLTLTLYYRDNGLEGEYQRQGANGAAGGHIDFKAAP